MYLAVVRSFFVVFAAVVAAVGVAAGCVRGAHQGKFCANVVWCDCLVLSYSDHSTYHFRPLLASSTKKNFYCSIAFWKPTNFVLIWPIYFRTTRPTGSERGVTSLKSPFLAIACANYHEIPPKRAQWARVRRPEISTAFREDHFV